VKNVTINRKVVKINVPNAIYDEFKVVLAKRKITYVMWLNDIVKNTLNQHDDNYFDINNISSIRGQDNLVQVQARIDEDLVNKFKGLFVTRGLKYYEWIIDQMIKEIKEDETQEMEKIMTLLNTQNDSSVNLCNPSENRGGGL
jgi:hypothetical protein